MVIQYFISIFLIYDDVISYTICYLKKVVIFFVAILSSHMIVDRVSDIHTSKRYCDMLRQGKNVVHERLIVSNLNPHCKLGQVEPAYIECCNGAAAT